MLSAAGAALLLPNRIEINPITDYTGAINVFVMFGWLAIVITIVALACTLVGFYSMRKKRNKK